MKAKLFGFLPAPGMRWIPHDLPSQDGVSQKPKSHHRLFSIKSSKSSLENTPHGSLRARKSALSLGSEPDADLDARTHPQGQSLFFAMLPIEIRKTVYEFVMGEQTVHLTIGAKKRFGHFICEDRDGEEGGDRMFQRECGCRVLVGGRESEKVDAGCLSLVRSCRRMYSESIPHLYRPHIFSLLHITHLLYLPSSLPQKRLNSIRTLRLRWAIRALPYLRRGPTHRLAYREDTANWERGWAIIAGMQGLRHLYVAIMDPSPQDMWESSWVDLEEQLLQPVKNVTRPRWFELMLPFASCGTGWDMGESRCVLRKPEGWVVEEED